MEAHFYCVTEKMIRAVKEAKEVIISVRKIQNNKMNCDQVTEALTFALHILVEREQS